MAVPGPGSTPDKILRAFRDKLLARGDLTGLNSDTIVIVQKAGVQIPETGFVWAGIKMNGGAFRSEEFAGGGENSLYMDTQIVVDIHSGNQLDPAGENAEMLSNEDTGLLPFTTGILQAIAVNPPFYLVDCNGVGLLAELLEPLDWQIPEAERGKGISSLAFRCCFVWDVSCGAAV